jgi:hypothetical protein
VKDTTKKVFNTVADYLDMTHDELVREMLIEYVELNNIVELFPLINKLKDKDKDNED